MKINIFHTNDIHSEFQNLIKLNTYLKKNITSDDLLVDAGDLCDLKSILVQGTDGLGAIELISDMGYDAICIGNNEIDLEHDKLESLTKTSLPIVSCNVFDNNGSEIGDVLSSVILVKNNVKFLVVGISPYYSKNLEPNSYNNFFNMGNINTVEPIERLKNELNKYRGQYDISVVLSHSGIHTDNYIIENVKGIDIMIGGHSHSLIESPYVINDTIYTQAYQSAEVLGRLELEIVNGKIIEFDGKIIKNEFAEDEQIKEKFLKWEQIAINNLNKTLYTIEMLNWDANRENELTNFICDALYYEYKCDLSFINCGIVNGPICGDISALKLIELSPSKLNPTRMQVLGKNLKEAIELSLDKEFTSQKGNGAGFRGNVLGTLCFSHNVKIKTNPLEIKINGELLDDNHIYDCMSHDYLQRGTYYTSLAVDDTFSVFYEGFIRDLMLRHLNNNMLVEQCKIRRITYCD